MPNFKEGDRVRIVAREQSEEDAKSGMYFGHYAGLTGTVQKVYSKHEVAVNIEYESLTREIRRRHEDVRDQMKTKWLDGLSEEGRSRLTEREKDFILRYVVLVAMSDLEKAGAKPAASPPGGTSASASPALQETGSEATAPRKTLADLDAAEEAELRRRPQQSQLDFSSP